MSAINSTILALINYSNSESDAPKKILGIFESESGSYLEARDCIEASCTASCIGVSRFNLRKVVEFIQKSHEEILQGCSAAFNDQHLLNRAFTRLNSKIDHYNSQRIRSIFTSLQLTHLNLYATQIQPYTPRVQDADERKENDIYIKSNQEVERAHELAKSLYDYFKHCECDKNNQLQVRNGNFVYDLCELQHPIDRRIKAITAQALRQEVVAYIRDNVKVDSKLRILLHATLIAQNNALVSAYKQKITAIIEHLQSLITSCTEKKDKELFSDYKTQFEKLDITDQNFKEKINAIHKKLNKLNISAENIQQLIGALSQNISNFISLLEKIQRFDLQQLDSAINQYLTLARRDGYWVGLVELYAISKILQCRIHLFTLVTSDAGESEKGVPDAVAEAWMPDYESNRPSISLRFDKSFEGFVQDLTTVTDFELIDASEGQ